MNAFLKVVLSFVLAFLIAGSVFADQTGEIRGSVTDVSGEPLPGAVVTAKSPSLQGQRTAVSDPLGAFRLPLLPIGTYDLTFTLPGFDGLTQAGVDVRLGQTVAVPVAMKLAGITGAVTVTSENPLVDATKSDTSYRLRGAELARIPAQGRMIAEVVGFTPGGPGVGDEGWYGELPYSVDHDVRAVRPGLGPPAPALGPGKGGGEVLETQGTE